MKKHHHHLYDLCKQHMHSYVLAETTDGTKFDGIVTGLDDEYVYFAVPIDPTNPLEMGDYGYQPGMEHTHTPNYQYYPEMEHGQMQGYYGVDGHMQGQQRQFGYGYPGYGYPGYGFPGYGYGFGYGRPRRRFRRLVLPLAALVALSTLPWY